MPKFAVQSDEQLLVPVLEACGWQRTFDDDWDLYWGANVPDLPSRGPAARVANHLSGSGLLHRKDVIYRLIELARERSPDAAHRAIWEFVPQTFVLPDEEMLFHAAARSNPQAIWIAKPANWSRGRGVFLLPDPSHAPVRKGWIVQRYIDRPHLIENRKYTLRIYVALLSLDPLVAYICKAGLVKRSAEAYSSDPSQFSNSVMHIVNSDIQREASGGPLDALGISEYENILAKQGQSSVRLWERIRRVSALTLLAAREALIASNAAPTSQGVRGFELLGLDILVDAEMHPWLIEVNRNPDLGLAWKEGGPERATKTAMLSDLLRLVFPLEGGGVSARANAGTFELIFPHPEANEWMPFWFPRCADRETFLQTGLPVPPVGGHNLLKDAQFVEDGAILFSSARQNYLSLNQAAAFAAVSNDDGEAPESAQMEQMLLTIWQHRLPEGIEEDFPREEAEWTRVFPASDLRLLIGATLFSVECEQARFRHALEDVLGYLLASNRAAGARSERIRVRGSESSITVESRFERCQAREDSMPAAALSTMLRAAYHARQTLIAFHAGAVSRRGKAIIVAGRSGRGKTTLVASLMASGFGFLSDEAAILLSDFTVMPAPAPLSLTTESLPLLSTFLPEAMAIGASRRRDGTRVHYLKPSPIEPSPLPACAIVFPCVAPGQPTELQPLGVRESFERLHEAGFDLPNRLTVQQARSFVSWLCTAHRFILRIGSLAEAVQLVDQLPES